MICVNEITVQIPAWVCSWQDMRLWGSAREGGAVPPLPGKETSLQGSSTITLVLLKENKTLKPKL